VSDASQTIGRQGGDEPPRGREPVRPPREERRARLRRQRLYVLAAAAGVVVVVLVLLFTVGPFGSHLDRPGKPPLGYLREPLGGRQHKVTAWTLGDAASLQAATAANAVDEIDFDWYHTQVDGSVTAEDEDPDLVGMARDRDLNIFATVTNSTSSGKAFSRDLAAEVLASPDRRQRFIDDLVTLVRDMGYDGVDLDWEDLRPADRDSFSSLVEDLAAALHAEDRFLSIAVMPKTSEPGEWDNQKYADWSRIGKAVDEFKIMTYSYSGPWGDPGPQAPTEWVDRVLTFAERKVPPGKVFMGLPFYGFDWHSGSVATVSAHRGASLAQDHDATVTRDPSSKEATMTFTDGGETHTVYFQDDAAVAAKLVALRAKHPRIAGISIWVMSQEASGFWPLIARKLR
jgi:spore germination protein